MRPNNATPAAIFIVTMLSASSLMASESTSPQVSPSVTQGQLEQLHIRNVILQAEVQGAQLQRQLDENQSGTGSAVLPSVPGSTGLTTLPVTSPRPSSGNGKPVVLEINGRDKNLRATLQLSSGQTLVVSPGSRLPGTEQTVKTITLGGVTLSDGSLLTFGG